MSFESFKSFELFFAGLFDDFINPSERLYWPLLLLSVFLAWLFLFLTGENKKKSLISLKEHLLNGKIWLHPSSILDAKIFLFNNFIRLVFLVFFAGFLTSSYSISLYFIEIFRKAFGEISPLSQNWFVIRLSYTVFTFILLDFFRFYQHYLMHKIPLLWKFHQVHHSAEVLTPLTLNRMHPVEMFIGMARTALVNAISSALYVYLFQVPLYGFDILGINMFGFLFNAIGANLRHSAVWISYGSLEYLFISPAQHQVHHSKDPLHFNKNFGICFSVWDLLFKSFYRANKKISLQFGLKDKAPRSVRDAYFRLYNP